MEWYIRLINGLPPRKNSDDRQQFFKAFPEARNSQTKLSPLFPFFYIPHKNNIEDIIKLWTNDDQVLPLQECELKFCPRSQRQNNEGNYIELVRLPPNDADSDELKIISFLNDLKKVTGELPEAKKILYFDSYIVRSLFEKREITNKVLEKIKKEYSLKEIKLLGPAGWYTKSSWNHKEVSEINDKIQSDLSATFTTATDDIHDRFIAFLNVEEKPIAGVSIGTSINSLFGKKSYFILKLESADLEITINQIR